MSQKLSLINNLRSQKNDVLLYFLTIYAYTDAHLFLEWNFKERKSEHCTLHYPLMLKCDCCLRFFVCTIHYDFETSRDPLPL